MSGKKNKNRIGRETNLCQIPLGWVASYQDTRKKSVLSVSVCFLPLVTGRCDTTPQEDRRNPSSHLYFFKKNCNWPSDVLEGKQRRSNHSVASKNSTPNSVQSHMNLRAPLPPLPKKHTAEALIVPSCCRIRSEFDEKPSFVSHPLREYPDKE